jgi:ABC-type branched-subunit amino acid transport system ATPase component
LDGRALLEVDSIHSGYGKMEILHGVSLTVKEGEIVSIIGPNGAGKSTALKTIIGFLRPTRGRVLFNGSEITGTKTEQILRKGLAYVPQGRIVFPWMTALENLEMGAFTEKDKGKISERIERVFSLFPILRERQHQKAGTMSGGEQQMLSVGRALMVGPRVLMLDEPSLGLSPKFVDIVFDKILEMRETGMTLVLVEQNAARALEISDRGYVLELGQNRFQGTGQGLLANEEVRRMYLGGHGA